MSYDENAGLALAGELSAMSLLKLLSGSAKNNPIPPKYTGSAASKLAVGIATKPTGSSSGKLSELKSIKEVARNDFH